MPADLSRFNLAIDCIGGSSIRVFFYLSEDDRDTVLSGGYFDGAMELGLSANDMIYVADLNNPGTTYDLRVESVSDHSGEVVVVFAFQEYVDTLRPYADIPTAQAGTSTATVLNPAGGAALVTAKFPGLLAASDFSNININAKSLATVNGAAIGGNAAIAGVATVGGGLGVIGNSSVVGDLNVDGLLTGAKYNIGATGSVPVFIVRRFARSPQVTDFGCIGDNATDDTANFQKAINYAQANGFSLEIPPVASGYKLSDTININAGLHLWGTYPRPFLADINIVSTRGPGSWLHFAHTGRGITTTGSAANTVAGGMIEKIGTFRDQPITTGPTFTPNNHDWDFAFETSDVMMRDIMMYNATRGIYAHQAGNGYGSLFLDNINGQPLNTGIQLRDQFRQCIINNVNFWSYYSGAPAVNNYMLGNRVAFDVYTQDGMQCTNLFAIWNNVGIRFNGDGPGDQQPGRGLLRGQFTNLYFDYSKNGIYVNSNLTRMLATFNNTVIFGSNPTATGSYGIVNTGTNASLDFTNLEISNVGNNAIYNPNSGSNNEYNLVNLRSESWNIDNAGSQLILAASGATVRYSPIVSANGNGASVTGGAGTFVSF